MSRSRALRGRELAASEAFEKFARHVGSALGSCATCRGAVERFGAKVAAACKPGAPHTTETDRETHIAECCAPGAILLRAAHALSVKKGRK